MTLTIITFSHDDDIVYYDVEHDAPLIVLWAKKAKKKTRGACRLVFA